MGTAEVQGDLWGGRAADWAEIQEATVRPVYDAVLDRAGVRDGTRVLDVGCGAGLFLDLAARRGANVVGVDAAKALIAIARARAPQGDFRIADMESLPFPDQCFDLVTGFNAFQYAADPVNALRQARRVVRPDGMVVVMVWGDPAGCEAAAYLRALGSMLPPPPPGAPGPFALSVDGALEALVAAAGLEVREARQVDAPWVYPDLSLALRGMLSAGPAVRAIRHSGEEAVAGAVAAAIAPYRQPDGSYRLRNLCRYAVTVPSA